MRPTDEGELSVQPPQPMRVVFDTNALISAVLFPKSVPGQAFTHARHNGTILVTVTLVTELRDVLARRKFERYLSAESRDAFLAAFVLEVAFVENTELITACRDPKDNHVLEAAINGAASCIVSGDNDLLILTPFRDVPIVTPAEYLSRFATPDS